jgi:hypothetical protein
VRPRKAESLNADLVRAGKYTVSEQKQVTVWLDLRNKAAQGKYSEYVKQQVGLMLDGVRDFIFRIRPWVTGQGFSTQVTGKAYQELSSLGRIPLD